MLTREDIYLFSHSTDSFLFNQAVTFKTVIQNEIADLVTPEEALYIVLPNVKINYNIIDKLINVAAKYWKRTLDKLHKVSPARSACARISATSLHRQST